VVAGLVVIAILAAVLSWSASRDASHARRPSVFGGSVVLDDDLAPTVVDVANATVTVRLVDVYNQVSAANAAAVQAVPVTGGTMLVNDQTGTFNLLGADDYLVDATGVGIGLGPLDGSTAAQGFSDGASAYIVRYGPQATVSLVDQATVAAGSQSQGSVRTAASVTPRG
jgi:hypothetical protein